MSIRTIWQVACLWIVNTFDRFIINGSQQILDLPKSISKNSKSLPILLEFEHFWASAVTYALLFQSECLPYNTK